MLEADLALACRFFEFFSRLSCPPTFGRKAVLLLGDAIDKAGAGFKSLKDTWADTTTPHGRLMLTVLGGLAEFERELIRARTDDGRKRAKARGVKFGRPVKLTAHQRKEAVQRLAEGAVQADLARFYGVSQATISRLAAPSPFGLSPAGA
jgi:DNA invertase Pin-like site-specific DNA recombinase